MHAAIGELQMNVEADRAWQTAQTRALSFVPEPPAIDSSLLSPTQAWQPRQMDDTPADRQLLHHCV